MTQSCRARHAATAAIRGNGNFLPDDSASGSRNKTDRLTPALSSSFSSNTRGDRNDGMKIVRSNKAPGNTRSNGARRSKIGTADSDRPFPSLRRPLAAGALPDEIERLGGLAPHGLDIDAQD